MKDLNYLLHREQLELLRAARAGSRRCLDAHLRLARDYSLRITDRHAGSCRASYAHKSAAIRSGIVDAWYKPRIAS